MEIELLLLTLLYAVAFAAFIGALNARGQARITVSYLLATLCLCGAVFNTARYFSRPMPPPDTTFLYSPPSPSGEDSIPSGPNAPVPAPPSSLDTTRAAAESASSHPAPAEVREPAKPVREMAPIKLHKETSTAKPAAKNAWGKAIAAAKPRKEPALPVPEAKKEKSHKEISGASAKPTQRPEPAASPKAAMATPAPTTTPAPVKAQAIEAPKATNGGSKPSSGGVASELSKVRLRVEMESAKRLVGKLVSLNLGFSSQMPDAEYSALGRKAGTLLDEAKKTKSRLAALSSQLSPELDVTRDTYAKGVDALGAAAVDAERFFKAGNEEEEENRLRNFQREVEAATAAFNDAATALEALDTAKTPK